MRLEDVPLRAVDRLALHRRAEHPGQPGVWLLGGGSGHGFKHGPAMAERLAPALRGEAVLPAHLGLGHRVAGDALWPIRRRNRPRE